MTRSEQVRLLVLMRHGKSDYPPGVADHERPLNARGRAQAAESGAWMVDRLPPIEAVICSTATRTRETLSRTDIVAPTRFEDALYGATPATILEEISLTDPTVRTLLVVGHFPGLPETALILGGGVDSPAVRSGTTGLPTSAVAVLDTDQPWDALTPGASRLIEVFQHGR